MTSYQRKRLVYPKHSLEFCGEFKFTVNGKKFSVPNSATLEGLEDILNTVFGGGGSSKSWYLGLISATGYTGTSINDTGSSHPGWVEFTGYSYNGSTTSRIGPCDLGTARGSLVAAVFFSVDNQITYTESGEVIGLFVSSGAAKGSGGILLASSRIFPSQEVVVGDTSDVSYTWKMSGTAATKEFPIP